MFPQIAQFFPLILAPGVIAMVRRQKPFRWLDGPLLVWLAVIGAAVLWTLLIALAYSEAITRGVVGRGVLLGITAALADTWATRKKLDPEAFAEVRLPMPSAPPTDVALPDLTPDTAGTARAMDLDFAADPKPSETP